ncbi:MAG: imidazoleglycerol-phosphate dehydratase HisB [Verrucomicrobia bacterium]|nr:imidazoleglycerol-phosphate dehydratase HisB [Verrucomicrobiota bacterium]MCH8528583.1 imidazoleglycerol-phosphate dehydratase HisB [Kiritimatiellia bacterium]
MNTRTASKHRKTRETDITLTLNLDGSGVANITTGVGFLDHMLELLTKHALLDLTVEAKGDLHVDDHHTVEDVGIVLGEALNEALGDRKGIRRYGWALLPMDEAMARVALDLGGRPFLVYDIDHPATHIKDFDLQLLEEFWRAFSTQARMNLHIAQLYGKDVHHAHEAVFKGVAKALDYAKQHDPRVKGVPSSKDLI